MTPPDNIPLSTLLHAIWLLLITKCALLVAKIVLWAAKRHYENERSKL